MTLQGKVAWITGGGSGIGLAGAIELAKAGCQVVISGRDAAKLDAAVRRRGARVVYPPVALCTDNGAMIAWAGALRLRKGRMPAAASDVGASGFGVRPRWPLDQTAPAMIGSGKRGAKA